MRLLSRLENRFGSFAIPNLTLYLAFGQLCCLLLILARPEFVDQIVLWPALVMQGEWWRLFTFIFFPLFGWNPLFAVFGLIFFYFIGNVLESHWGTFRFNLFLLVGYLATIAASFIQPEEPASNVFVNGSMFLAFAILYPDYVIYLFFILPLKVKWLAMLELGLYFMAMIAGSWSTRVTILASLANVLLFFRREIVESWRTAGRKIVQRKRKAEFVAPADDAAAPFHVCAACGINDRTHPKAEFRYCPQCVGGLGYCMDHIHNHVHRVSA